MRALSRKTDASSWVSLCLVGVRLKWIRAKTFVSTKSHRQAGRGWGTVNLPNNQEVSFKLFVLCLMVIHYPRQPCLPVPLVLWTRPLISTFWPTRFLFTSFRWCHLRPERRTSNRRGPVTGSRTHANQEQRWRALAPEMESTDTMLMGSLDHHI